MVRNTTIQHQNSDSAYFEYPSEGPNSVVVSPKFNGSNYLAWSRSMQRALGAKNKLSFINGSLPMSDHEDLNHDAWERCNHLVHSWIINSISDSIAQIIVFHDNALDVWEDLKECFSKVDRIRNANLRSSIKIPPRPSKFKTETYEKDIRTQNKECCQRAFRLSKVLFA